MHKIIFFILLACFPLFSLHAEAVRPGSNGFILAQNAPEIELPSLPDTPPVTAPQTEEKKTEGDAVTPALPSVPTLPPVGNTIEAPAEYKPLEPAVTNDLPLSPAVPAEPEKETPATTEAPKEETKTEQPLAPPAEQPAPPPVPSPTEAKPAEPSTTEGEKPAKAAGETEEEKPAETTPPAAEAIQTGPAICTSLPKNLENCQSYSCEYPDFDKNFPGFVKTWEVVRKNGDACEYNESMPRNATLQCRLSEKSRKPYADYMNTSLIQHKSVTDKETLEGYNNARQNECQIVSEEGEVIDPKLYNTLSSLPENVEDYGASDAPQGDCETLDEKLTTCEPFYCKGNDPLQEKFFNRKVEIERKVIGWVENTCIYVQKTGGKNLVGCKYNKTDGTNASQCNLANLAEIARVGTLFNKKTLAEKAAEGETTITKPEKVEEPANLATNKETLMALSELNYKTQTLPYIIHRKQYDKQNKDLPIAYYPKEFKVMVFTALDRNDLVALRAFIDKVKEIDGQLKKQKKPPLGGLEIRDNNGNTLLIRSIMIGNFQAAQMLVGGGADIDVKNKSGVTPLQAAAYSGKEEIVVLLLGMGAKRDIADKYGRTALTHAIEKNYDRIAKLLLSSNADPNAASGGMNIPPLVTAAKLGNTGAAASLLDNHANVNLRDSDGRTALMYAAQNGDAALVNLLIGRGANVFLQDRSGQTAEMLASNAGHAEVARILASVAIDKRLHR